MEDHLEHVKHEQGGSGSVRQWWFWHLPNKTKLLLQVLAVAIGNSEKNKVDRKSVV